MSYVLSLIVAATVLGATQAGSEEVGLGVSVRWVDNGVTVGTSLNRCYDTDWNTSAIKEGESDPPEMIAIIERNREDRERQVVIDRNIQFPAYKGQGHYLVRKRRAHCLVPGTEAPQFREHRYQ